MIDTTFTPRDIPFQDVLDALMDKDTVLKPHYLSCLSDLEGEDLAEMKKIWPGMPVGRRQALLEDIEKVYAVDYLLSFESIYRIGVEDSNPHVRFIAIRALLEYEVRDMIPFFINVLETDEDEELRALAAILLGKYVFLGEIEELPPNTLREMEESLLRVAQGTDTVLVRRRAVESLGCSSRDEVPALIEAAFTAEDTDWLVSGILAMGRSFDKRWYPNVLSMLDHLLPEVRYEAARAAGELEISEAVTSLMEMLDDDNDDVRMAAVWSLAQIGGEGVQAALDMLLDETESEEEAEFIESALDHLIFYQGFGTRGIMGLPKYDDFDF